MSNMSARIVSGGLLAIVLYSLTGESAMSLEEPEYSVLYRDGDIEYRQYESYLVAETVVESTAGYGEAGNEGFRRLFRYISGANESQAKIDMTAPVARAPSNEKIAMTAPVQRIESTDGWRVSFMLPAQYTIETAPIPEDDRIRINTVPGRLMAVLRYSGRWTEKNLVARANELREAVDAAGMDRIGELESAAYDPPYKLPFLRRNEVMVEVDRSPTSAEQSLMDQSEGS